MVISEFAWRENTGVKPNFKGLIEWVGDSDFVYVNRSDELIWSESSIIKWRPSLKQQVSNSKPIFRTNEDAQQSLDEHLDRLVDSKPVFTQAMDDIEYELSLHKANSELLASLTDFMVKNGIGRIGESCIDVAIRELSEKFNIDQRTPKQKAVDAAIVIAHLDGQDYGYLKSSIGKLYDAGLLKC